MIAKSQKQHDDDITVKIVAFELRLVDIARELGGKTCGVANAPPNVYIVIIVDNKFTEGRLAGASLH